MFTLIEHGDIFAPRPRGTGTLLLADSRIDRIDRDGSINAHALEDTGFDVQTIDATDCVVFPGLIDPHAHLIGAGGEQGFGSRQPEMTWHEIAAAGVTTIVGCLGTDTIGRSMRDLLAKSREIDANGVTTFLYTGGFPVPPATITGSALEDIILIDKVVGVGETAIADERSSQPTIDDLAKLVASAFVAGTVSGKCGVTHFHVGPTKRRLSQLHELLDRFDIGAKQIYPTHVTRSEALLDDAIALAARGCFVDTDCVEAETPQWIQRYVDRKGALDRFTVSSDANTPGGSAAKLYATFAACVRDLSMPLETVLPFFTRNVAAALQLSSKGSLKNGADADVVIANRDSLQIEHVIARGRIVYSRQTSAAPINSPRAAHAEESIT